MALFKKRTGLAEGIRMSLNEEDLEFAIDLASKHKTERLKYFLKSVSDKQRKTERLKNQKKLPDIPEIGYEMQWQDAVSKVFRVIGFDRNGTMMNSDGNLIPKSVFIPYGYLIVEYPLISESRVSLPIIHRDDFMLADNVFSDSDAMKDIKNNDIELLVTYLPKNTENGFSTTPHHVLHFCLAPVRTQEMYYLYKNGVHFHKPNLSLLFKISYTGKLIISRSELKIDMDNLKQS